MTTRDVFCSNNKEENIRRKDNPFGINRIFRFILLLLLCFSPLYSWVYRTIRCIGTQRNPPCKCHRCEAKDEPRIVLKGIHVIDRMLRGKSLWSFEVILTYTCPPTHIHTYTIQPHLNTYTRTNTHTQRLTVSVYKISKKKKKREDNKITRTSTFPISTENKA